MNPSSESQLFCVKWIPSVENFFDYIRKFREVSGISLGGSRRSSYHYSDPTITKVLSVGPNDHHSSLPHRISLSNFKLGTPITSYGCIYRSVTDKVRYLIIQRKDSVGYVDLIRGTYRESQLFFMIQDLPLRERERLLNHNFEDLWKDFHLKGPDYENKLGEGFEYAKGVFQKIQPYISDLFKFIPPADPEGKNLWLFPKGKLNWSFEDMFDAEENSTEAVPKLSPESPFDCALREFREETNGHEIRESGKLLFADPVVERFLGSNSKNYQTNYFVFQTDTLPKIKESERRATGIREISLGEVEKCCWVELEELSKHLRPERLELIRYIEDNLSNQFAEDVSPIWKSSLELVDPVFENKC